MPTELIIVLTIGVLICVFLFIRDKKKVNEANSEIKRWLSDNNFVVSKVFTGVSYLAFDFPNTRIALIEDIMNSNSQRKICNYDEIIEWVFTGRDTGYGVIKQNVIAFTIDDDNQPLLKINLADNQRAAELCVANLKKELPFRK